MAEKMQAVAKTKPGKGLELIEAPVPKPKEDELLLKIKACSLCGTDVHIYNWDSPWDTRFKEFPRILGHELCGEVLEVGKHAKGFEAGDFVAAESHIACGTCYQCLVGKAHICANLKFFGVHVDGSFAEYMVMPAVNAWKTPKSFPPEIATLQESLGNSVYTVHTQAKEIFGKYVTIFGGGPTGQFAVALAKLAGAAKIMMITGTEEHQAIAKKMGADVIVDRHKEDIVKRILEETNNQGADVMLEMSGSGEAIEQGFQSLRQGGSVALLGLPSKPITLDWSRYQVLKDANVKGIYGREMFRTWEITSNLLKSGKLDIRPVITHKYKLSEFAKAFETMQSGKCGKVIMYPK